MEDFFAVMFVPFLACLVLTGIHTYLGLHVLRRGVIFVDLALAQLAALGATLGYLFGFHLHSPGSYLSSLLTALIGAFFFAASRGVSSRIPQEAVIGVVYAVAAAASIVVLSGAPEGGEELKTLLIGHLLFVDVDELVHMLIMYLPIGVLLYLTSHRLWQISAGSAEEIPRGRRLLWWDFLFYGAFAIVVTSSVEMAGVLLVFSFLIVPAACANLLASSLRSQLLVGWGIGFLTSGAGIAASYFLNLPTGAAVVCAFGVVFAICALFPTLRRGS